MFASLIYFMGLGVLSTAIYHLTADEEEKIGFSGIVGGIGLLIYAFAYFLNSLNS